jgi:glyoxylase-like metal-dependent hydrolase (beta-lactamase superfamily II)
MSLEIDQVPVPPIGTNCYVVRTDRNAEECVVIDPGGAADELRLHLERLGTKPVAILVTHCHWDHLGAVAELAEAYGATVYMEEREASVLEHPGDWYPDVPVRPYAADVRLAGDETLELAGIAFQTLSVPGHSPGHVAYYADGELFSGDVLFQGSVGRTDLTGGDWHTLLASIRMLFERLPPETRVFPGHGFPTTLARERDRNPFLAELRETAGEERA